MFTEKPLTHNVHESVQVMKAVDKKKAILQTGSMQRSSREFRVACELVRNGVIGKVKSMAVNIGNAGIPYDLPTEEEEPGLDWDRWVGPGPMRGWLRPQPARQSAISRTGAATRSTAAAWSTTGAHT